MINKSRKLYFFFARSITFNTFLESMAKRLREEFHIILCAKDTEKIDTNKFQKKKIFIPLNFLDLINFKKLLATIITINQITKNAKKNVIFCHTPAISHLVRIISFFNKPNIVYFVHGFRFNDSRNFISNYFFKVIEIILSLNTKYYITINNSDFEFVKKILRKPVIKISGVGLERKIKIKKNKQKKHFLIGMIGAYKKNKGYHVIIKNYSKIKKIIPNLKIQTYGYESNYKLKEKIKMNKFKNFQINNFEKKILNKLINFDLLLHPSFREGLSVSIMQSLQYGVPVIARNIPGNIDLIKNNFNGYLFDNEREMIHYIKKIYLSKKLRNKLSNNAAQTIDTSYLKKTVNEKILKFIKQI